MPATQRGRPLPAPSRDQRGAQRRTDGGRHELGADLQLYDQLLAVAPTPIVALNRAVAVAEVEGPHAALAAVDSLDLGAYHLFHATRADLLARLGRSSEAVEAYTAALALTSNAIERRFLTTESGACDASS